MDTLYLVCKFNENNKMRYIGYVIFNMAAVKVMEASTMEDVEAYCEMRGFKQWKFRVPKEQKYQLIRTKGW